VLNGPGHPPNGTPLNGWGRLLGYVGVPGAIALYLVVWLTSSLGGKLDRIIQLLDQIARALRVGS
jgi:hypothetical protein